MQVEQSHSENDVAERAASSGDKATLPNGTEGVFMHGKVQTEATPTTVETDSDCASKDCINPIAMELQAGSSIACNDSCGLDQYTPQKRPSQTMMEERLSEIKGVPSFDAEVLAGNRLNKKRSAPRNGRPGKKAKAATEQIVAQETDGCADGIVEQQGSSPELVNAHLEPKITSAILRRKPRKKAKEDIEEVTATETNKARHSLFDMEALAKDLDGLEDASPEILEQFPHALKSFEHWLTKGPLKKSAKNYRAHVGMLVKTHRKSIAALQEKRYYKWVIASSENKVRNGQFSAGLANFQKFIAARGGSVDGPWEENALAEESHYDVKIPIRTKGRRTDDAATEDKKTYEGDAEATPRPKLRRHRISFWGNSGNLSKEQLKRIEENRHAALLRRQERWMAERQQLSHEEIPTEVAQNRSETSTGKSAQLSPEQLLQIEANRKEALRRRQERLQRQA